MSWISSFPKIANKDCEPDNRWNKLVDKVINIFDEEIFTPVEYNSYSYKSLSNLITDYFEDLENNFSKIRKIDCAKSAERLLKLLRPGRTATVLMEKNLIDNLMKSYSGSKEGLFVKFTLNYVNEDGQNDQFRVFPKEYYNEMLDIISNYSSGSVYRFLLEEIMDKIELAAFCKGGDRRARWKLDEIHPEYGSFEDCHHVAAKLSNFLLDYLDDDLIKKNLNQGIRSKLVEAKKECFNFFNNKEKTFVNDTLPKSICPVCLNKIFLNDFFRNGRNDEQSLVFGHYSFRGNRDQKAHVGKNAFWLHRTCNYIQGDYTIEERIKMLVEIVKKHDKQKINWENRG